MYLTSLHCQINAQAKILAYMCILSLDFESGSHDTEAIWLSESHDMKAVKKQQQKNN